MVDGFGWFHNKSGCFHVVLACFGVFHVLGCTLKGDNGFFVVENLPQFSQKYP